jgi:predicted HTH transcriptional regulator
MKPLRIFISSVQKELELERAAVVSTVVSGPVTPAIEAQLNERQKSLLPHVLSAGTVTRGWCVAEFKVANDTAGRDLKMLLELGLLKAQGKGRAARYVIKTTDNRPAKS